MPDLYDQATRVTAAHGDVILDGPDGVDVAMTPEAALATSDRLLEGALAARGQQLSDELVKRQHEAWDAARVAAQAPDLGNDG